jgi:tRNA threonylcarbamoyladenosine biosynthesis protein TsaB
MRVLAIETSTRRGSVALVESGRVVAAAAHERPNAHAEAMLPLLDELLASSGWAKSSLDRLGVGVGPGSFTGIRVGIALGQGIGLALGRPVYGVGSLEAMAFAVPAEHAGARCPLVDARRGEVFVAVYGVDGDEREPPRAVAHDQVLSELALLAPGPRVVIGEMAVRLGIPELLQADACDLPHATSVALIAATLGETRIGAEPRYVRDAGALLPNLPPSPLAR